MHNRYGDQGSFSRRSAPYELKLCSKCGWYAVQEHFILGCPQDLTKLCTQFQHPFSFALPNCASRLRGFISQADVLGSSKFVPESFSFKFDCLGHRHLLRFS
eukprot:3039-Pelagomonas_calceolata.AAC.1